MVRLPAFLSSRHLVFDDGTYGVSVLDMRHGLAPYRGVFSAQGPLHFSLLYVGDLLGFRTIDGPRVAPMLAGVAATIAAWAIARRLAGGTAGVIAGVLVATSGSMIWTTGQVTGDGIASAIAVCAVWAALAYRDDPRLRRAVVTGLVMGAAIAVKPLILPAAIPVGWWLWSRRRADHLGGRGRGGGGAVARVGAAVGAGQRVGPVGRLQQRRRARGTPRPRSSASSSRRSRAATSSCSARWCSRSSR